MVVPATETHSDQGMVLCIIYPTCRDKIVVCLKKWLMTHDKKFNCELFELADACMKASKGINPFSSFRLVKGNKTRLPKRIFATMMQLKKKNTRKVNLNCPVESGRRGCWPHVCF